jgi:thymidylate kinase
MILALEGLPLVGKTTIIEELVKQHSDIAVVAEHFAFIEEPLCFPVTPLDFEKNHAIFLDIEVRRSRSSSGTHQHFVMDRTYLSSLVFNEYFSHNKEWARLVEKDYEEAVLAKNVIVPNFIVLIKEGFCDLVKRMTIRGKALDSIWLDQSVRAAIYDSYKLMMRSRGINYIELVNDSINDAVKKVADVLYEY